MTYTSFIEICREYAREHNKFLHPNNTKAQKPLYKMFKEYCIAKGLSEDEEESVFEWLDSETNNPDVMIDGIVKCVCKELNVTQKELSEILGVHLTTIQKWSANDTDLTQQAKNSLNLVLENHYLKEKVKKSDKVLSAFKELLRI